MMRGLELRKGTIDLVVNDLTPDIALPAREATTTCRWSSRPGVDYQYLGLNLRDPVLQRRAGAPGARLRHRPPGDRRVSAPRPRRAGRRPPAAVSWAFAAGRLRRSRTIPPGRGRCSTRPATAIRTATARCRGLRLTLKISTRSSSTACRPRSSSRTCAHVGIDLDVRTYEFATLYADVLKGNFQLYTLQWTAGSLADPDILRRVFHSTQVPPAGFNRGHYSNPARRRAARRGRRVGRRARAGWSCFRRSSGWSRVDVPYISLWNKTNFVMARRSLSGVHVDRWRICAFSRMSPGNDRPEGSRSQ